MATARSLPFTIPKCIRRSKTAMLKALSDTVGVDKTAPHYAFIDDPTTIPTSAGDRRNYFLAKEYGRRAARQLATEWPTLFMFDRDKPRLEAFRPETVPSLVDAEKVDENSLRRLIQEKYVSGALTVFERLRAVNTKFSPDVVQELFSLAAYFNAQDPPPSEIEEWPALRFYFIDPEQNTIQSAEIVNLLYSMVDKNVANYSTLICWLCKYGSETDKKRAVEMFNESVAKKWVLEEDAYIGLINQSTTIDETKGYLKNMAKLKVKPSIRIFNAAITAIPKSKDFKLHLSVVQAYLNEANRLGLEPNLTTYHLVLNVFREHSLFEHLERLQSAVNCLSEIITKLKAQDKIECQQFSDQQFFATAMAIATYSKNIDLMERVDKLYNSKKNQVKLTAFTLESGFYSRYLFKKVSLMSDVDKIGELYTSLVPRVVGVTRELNNVMIQKLRGSNNWPLTKRVIEDGLCSRFIMDEHALNRFLRLLDEFKLDTDEERSNITKIKEFEGLVVRIVDFLLEFANFSEEEVLHKKISPQVLCECIVLLLRTTQKDKAWSLLNMFLKKNDRQIKSDGYPRTQTLLDVFNYALQEDSVTNAANCLQLINQYNASFNLEPLVEKMTFKFKLGNTQKQVLLNFSKA